VERGVCECSRQEADAGAFSPASTPVDDADAWTRSDSRWYLGLLVLGALWPFLQRSFLLDEEKLVWPWDLLGSASPLPVFALLPLAAAALAFGLRRLENVKLRSLLLAATALGALLVLCLLSFGEEVIFLGAGILQAPVGPRLVLLLWTLAAACVAAGNRLGKEFQLARTPRLLTGLGGAVLTAPLCLPVMDGSVPLAALVTPAAWRSETSSNLLLLGIFTYGALATANGFRHGRRERFAIVLSVLGRGILVGIVAALLIDAGSSGSQVATILSGGPAPVIMALLKCCAVAYGLILLLTVGLAGALAVILWERAEPLS